MELFKKHTEQLEMNYKDPAIIELRKKNYQFDRLSKKHEQLEKDIQILTDGVGNSADEELKIAALKKEKLSVKEQLIQLLKQHG